MLSVLHMQACLCKSVSNWEWILPPVTCVQTLASTYYTWILTVTAHVTFSPPSPQHTHIPTQFPATNILCAPPGQGEIFLYLCLPHCIQHTYNRIHLWIVFSNDGCTDIFHPTCSAYNVLTLLPMFSLFESEWQLNDTMWLVRLCYKIKYSFRWSSGCLHLKPSCHVVKKHKPHGEATGKCSHWAAAEKSRWVNINLQACQWMSLQSVPTPPSHSWTTLVNAYETAFPCWTLFKLQICELNWWSLSF